MEVSPLKIQTRMNKKGPHTNTFITNIHSPNLRRSNSRLNRRTYRGNNFIPNISNYYKQSANNSKKIQSLGKVFEKIAANTEQNFRNTNMKQKLHNEMREIENDEIKRKARRTQKQINNENRQETDERNQLQREIQEQEERYQLQRKIQEKEDNLYAKYPTIEHFRKPGAKGTTSEHLIQFMNNNPKHPLTTNLKNRYGNGGTLGFSYGIGKNEHNAKVGHDYNQINQKPLYNKSKNKFKSNFKGKSNGRVKTPASKTTSL
jgi:hypothetical protein